MTLWCGAERIVQRTILLAWASLAGCFVLKDLPIASVNLMPTDAQAVVFQMCADPSKSASIGLITVKRADTGAVLCEFVSRDPMVKVSMWHMDRVPEGFEAVGKCPPLRAGEPYEISIMGNASGRRKFSVDEHRRIVLRATDDC
jgi:hypothetical protein